MLWQHALKANAATQQGEDSQEAEEDHPVACWSSTNCFAVSHYFHHWPSLSTPNEESVRDSKLPGHIISKRRDSSYARFYNARLMNKEKEPITSLNL